MTKNLCVITTLSTIVTTLVLVIVKYVLNQSFELVDIVVFAAVYGILFYLGQIYFSKRVKKKKK